MQIKRVKKNMRAAAAALIGCASLTLSSCGAEELRALVTGIEAAAAALDTGNSATQEVQVNADLNFGEWFLSELVD